MSFCLPPPLPHFISLLDHITNTTEKEICIYIYIIAHTDI